MGRFLKSKWFWLSLIVLSWILGGSVLVLKAYDCAQPDSKTLEAIKTAFLVLGGMGVVLPTYWNIWQTVENGKYIGDKIRFDMGENSYRLIEKFDDPSIGAARLLCRAIHDEKLNYSPAALVKKINDEKNLKDSVMHIFNYWENIRVSIKKGRVDEPMLRDSLAEAFNQHYDTFKPWVDTRSQKYQEDLAWLKKEWQ